MPRAARWSASSCTRPPSRRTPRPGLHSWDAEQAFGTFLQLMYWQEMLPHLSGRRAVVVVLAVRRAPVRALLQLLAVARVLAGLLANPARSVLGRDDAIEALGAADPRPHASYASLPVFAASRFDPASVAVGSGSIGASPASTSAAAGASAVMTLFEQPRGTAESTHAPMAMVRAMRRAIVREQEGMTSLVHCACPEVCARDER